MLHAVQQRGITADAILVVVVVVVGVAENQSQLFGHVSRERGIRGIANIVAFGTQTACRGINEFGFWGGDESVRKIDLISFSKRVAQFGRRLVHLIVIAP